MSDASVGFLFTLAVFVLGFVWLGPVGLLLALALCAWMGRERPRPPPPRQSTGQPPLRHGRLLDPNTETD